MKTRLQILVFLLFIGLPLVLYIFGIRSEIVDNRPPRTIAPLTWVDVKSSKWFFSVNDYLVDHTPLRDKLIRANAWIDWRLFGKMDNVHVSKGHDDWLFFNKSLDQPCTPKTEIALRFHNLATLAKTYQAQHGTRIVWVIAPDKEAIYPEKLTSLQTERAHCATTNRIAMREVLQDPALQPYIIGLWDVLEQGKSAQLYHKTDSHWNFKGATLGMETMLHHLWPGIYRKSDFYPAETIESQGDLGKMLGLADMTERETLWKTGRNGVMGGASEQPICMKAATARRRSFRHTSSEAPLIAEKVVILRDSFFDTPLHLVPPFFAQVDIGHIDHTPIQDWPAIATCADTLVIESVERSVLGRAAEFTKTFSRD